MKRLTRYLPLLLFTLAVPTSGQGKAPTSADWLGAFKAALRETKRQGYKSTTRVTKTKGKA